MGRKGPIFIALLIIILASWLFVSYRMEPIGHTLDSAQSSLPPASHPDCGQDCHWYNRRLRKYCHDSLLDGTEVSNEGNVGEQYELLHVHVVARHGDRTPVSTLKFGSKVYYDCGLAGASNWQGLDDFPPLVILSHNRLLSNQALYNGDIKECGDVEGVGKLTAKGFSQHFELGKILASKYKTFLPNIFNNIDSLEANVFFQSTAVQRTIQSLASFLLGFLPDSKTHREATKIHISPGAVLASPPVGIDTVYQSCHDYSRLVAQDRLESGYTSEEQIRRSSLSKLCSMFGMSKECEDLSIIKIFDTLFARGCHKPHEAMPCTVGACVTYSDAVVMANVVDWAWSKKYPVKTSTIVMSPFLNHSVLSPMEGIIKQLSSSKSEPGSYKLIVSLTHDDAITMLLVNLGITVTGWIPYSTRLVFELWRNKESNEFLLRVLFNGLDVTHRCSAWQNSTDNQLMPFAVFKEFVNTEPYRELAFYNEICKTS